MPDYNKTIQSLPPEYPENLVKKNRNAFLSSGFSLIVLDDDPTGTQTIFDVPVLTSWGEQEILSELKSGTKLFFILTNSRSLKANDADKLAYEIGSNIKKATEKAKRKTIVISRGDSTLRGHYPNEVNALGNGLGIPDAPHLVIPAFFEGGRYTIGNIHYVRIGNDLVPAGKTAFANDSTFGYRSSNLCQYVEEKTNGKIKAGDVVSMSLEEIREGGHEKLESKLQALKTGQVCIVNAAAQSDLDVFAMAFYRALKPGNTLLLRTAASVIPSLAGVEVQPPFQKGEIRLEGKGGIIAVGSYVPMTSKQLEYLQKHFPVEYIEINAEKLLDKKEFLLETERVAQGLNSNLEKNQVVVVYTSRKIIKGSNPEESLEIVNLISKGMVKVIQGVKLKPRFLLAKGGITSSDILTKALEVKKATVLGQIIPGVPLWRLEETNRFEGLIYMPFPGNLGGDVSVYKAVNKLI